jgi:hypothetical protein
MFQRGCLGLRLLGIVEQRGVENWTGPMKSGASRNSGSQNRDPGQPIHPSQKGKASAGDLRPTLAKSRNWSGKNLG